MTGYLRRLSSASSVVLLAGVLGLQWGCGKRAPESSEMAVTLGPGVSKVYETKVQDMTGLDPRVWDLTRLRVYDLARSGDRLLLTLSFSSTGIQVEHPETSCPSCPNSAGTSGGTSGWMVFDSSDTATWRTHTFAWPASIDVLLGVHTADGKAALVARDDYGTALGGGSYFYVMGVDLSTDLYVGAAFRPPGAVVAAGTLLWGYSYWFDPRNPDNGAYGYHSYDLATGVRTEFSRPYQLAGGCAPARWISQDGRVIEGLCTVGTSLCQATATINPASPASVLPNVNCAPLDRLPTAASALGFDPLPVATARGAIGMYSSGDQTYGVRVTGPFQVENLSLGSGQHTLETGLHRRYGGLIRVGDRLVEVPATGAPRQVLIPATPCVAGAPCGAEAEVQWVESLGGGEYLVFWKVNTLRGAGLHEFLYAGRVTATTEEIAQPSLLALLYPDAVEANPIGRACLAARRCWDTITTRNCISDWAQGFGRSIPTTSARREALLAAPPQDCAALAVAWPAAAVSASLDCSRRCVGNTLVTGCGRAVDCDSYGTACVAASGAVPAHCSDGTPYLVDTASRSACTENGGAWLTTVAGPVPLRCAAFGQVCLSGSSGISAFCAATCGSDRPFACDGGTAYSACNQGYLTRADCRYHEGAYGYGSYGPTCDVATGSCALLPATPACSQLMLPRCVGSSVTWCVTGSKGPVMRFVDCATLGGQGTCTGADGSARCQ
jgi:hypothetical protein